MISKESFEASWIEQKSKEFQYNDKNIIEKVIRAFSLLEMLVQSGCPFHFKGGSCLMLLLKNGHHRLSIDIDIICPPGTDIEQYLNAYKDYGFIDYKSVERVQRGTGIPKTHSKFFYQVAFLDDCNRQESILLDVLNEDCHYEKLEELPIESPFLKIEGTPSLVKVPSIGDILGDKLTAFAPNTTGIPYFKKTKDGLERDCSMEIIKQLYDVARLFEEIDSLEITAKSFEPIAEVELSYREMPNDPKLIFEDIRQTSLCLATRGIEGNGNFAMLQQGVSRIKSFMFRGNYFIDNAIADAAKAAYVATLLEKGQTAIERYDGNPLSISNLDIELVLTSKLNKLKRISPEAYFYWAKISQLLS
ncbi:MAG: nucleotidyl transferase AbiEii/AbiGii toxin family protein [Bacteroidales bacterium]|nr:nucleotidyl transferase AbiEii/AbiGii toxin family protein [Bacteroidales bacterium]